MHQRPPVIQLTDAAACEIKRLLSEKDSNILGFKVTVQSGGCSGSRYVFGYATEIAPLDETVNDKDVTIVIDSKAVMSLMGSVMDFIDEMDKRGFVFTNPNEKGKCGCGESFTI